MKNIINLIKTKFLRVFLMEKTVAKKAYLLLKDIPEEKWICFSLEDLQGNSCFLGHYGKLTNPSLFRINKAAACYDSDLNLQAKKFLRETYDIFEDATWVNDSIFVNGYKESTPKQRCMHLLKDMIEAGY